MKKNVKNLFTHLIEILKKKKEKKEMKKLQTHAVEKRNKIKFMGWILIFYIYTSMSVEIFMRNFTFE